MVLARMLKGADIFIQNLAPGAAARLGLASDALRDARPELITVDISGYGDKGPYAEMKAYDLLVQAETGLASITGHPAGPGRVGVSVCDIAAGMYAYMAVLEALIERRRSGQGRAIAVSLFDALADWMTVPLLQTVYGGAEPKRVGLNHPTIAPYGAYPTADGEIVISIQNEREWTAFCREALAMPDLIADPRFAGNPARVANRDALDEVIRQAWATRPREEVAATLQAAGIAYGRVNSPSDLDRHPQLRRVPVETPSGELALVAPPAQAGDNRQSFRPIPARDAQGEALRREFGQ